MTSEKEEVVVWAPQSDILYASQKDSIYLSHIRKSFVSFAECVLGGNSTNVFLPEIEAIATSFYFGLTTASGLQTLGEEYCYLLPVGVVEKDSIEYPITMSITSRCLLSLYLVLPNYIYLRGKAGAPRLPQPHRFPGQVRRNDNLSPYFDWIKRAIIYILLIPSRVVRSCFSLIPSSLGLNFRPYFSDMILSKVSRIHLALFFLTGYYFNPFRRIAKARYVARRIPKHPKIAFRFLGVLIFIGLTLSKLETISPSILSFLQKLMNQILMRLHNTDRRNSSDTLKDDNFSLQKNSLCRKSDILVPSFQYGDARPQRRNHYQCPVCQQPQCKQPTACPCGHVFCWDCVIKWVHSHPVCPLCRESCQPQELLCLVNLN